MRISIGQNRRVEHAVHTFQLSNIHAELVSFFQHALAALLNEVVELGGEFRHAIAQVVEAEIDAGQRVGH